MFKMTFYGCWEVFSHMFIKTNMKLSFKAKIIFIMLLNGIILLETDIKKLPHLYSYR